jgi:hypothetical protein
MELAIVAPCGQLGELALGDVLQLETEGGMGPVACAPARVDRSRQRLALLIFEIDHYFSPV